MKVYVVMGNDYPDSVFASDTVAQDYCDKKNEESKKEAGTFGGRRVYWRHYEFELAATTMCGEDAVHFPKTRAEQVNDLQALAGDALMRGDRIAWTALYRASMELRDMPEYDSNEGKLMSADLAAMLGKVTRQ